MEAMGIDNVPKTSAKRLNTIIKAATTNDRKYASKLANILKFAIHEKVPADELEKFIAKHGGIAKCIQAYLELNADEEETETLDAPPDFLKVIVLKEELMARIIKIKADANKLDKKRQKWQIALLCVRGR